MASALVIVTVFLLDAIAFGLAIAAERRRSKAQIVLDSLTNYNYCLYDSDIASGYGAGSLFFLLASQILVMAVSACLCCGRSLRPSGSRACAVFLFIICWFTFIIAEICLLAGSVRNAYHTKYRAKLNVENLSCETIRKGVFGAGAAFTFFTCIFGEFYYIYYSKAKATTHHDDHAGVGMTHYK